MDFSTVINFLSSEQPVPPTPGGGAETLNAQTGDAFAIIIAILFAAFVMSLVAFKLIQQKRVCASVTGEAKHASGMFAFGGKAKTIIASVLAVISVALIAGTITVQTTNALAESTVNQSGPLSAPEKVDAVVDSDTGQVTIDDFVVSNTDTETPFYKFNTVTATLEEGIDVGGCNWFVFLSNSEDISEGDDIIYGGPATGVAQPLNISRYIESNGVTHIRIKTDIAPEIAKTFTNTKVLNLKFGYDKESNVKPASINLNTENGHIEGEVQRPVVGNVAKLFVNNEDNTKLSIFDGCHWYDYSAVADEGYQIGSWTLNNNELVPGKEYPITADSIISALFVGKSAVLTYDANGGIEPAPKPYTGHIGDPVKLATYDGTSQGGSKATGWNTQADGNGQHYAFGSTFVLNEEAVTLYADWTNASFKALWDQGNNKLSFVYDKTTYYPRGIQVISLNDSEGNPKTVFDNQSDWGGDIEKIRNNVKTVVIETSVKAVSLQSINYMFAEMSSLDNITGLENLNWTTIQSVTAMFSKFKIQNALTLPKGIFANVVEENRQAFQNCSLTKIINEAQICCEGTPINFDLLWEGYRPWVNQETKQPVLNNEPLPAGTFVTNTISWTYTNIGTVVGSQGESKYFEDTDLESGKAIPSWVNKIIVKHKDTTKTGYMVKVEGTTIEGKDFKHYFNYNESAQGALIDLTSNIDCFTSDFNVEIFVPDHFHKVTANFESSNIADEQLYQYFGPDSKWTKNPGKENEFYVNVPHGAKALDILHELPSTGVTSKANNPYNMDNEKTFKEWGNDKDYKSTEVILEDVTFTPVYDYIVQIFTVPAYEGPYPMASLQITVDGEPYPAMPGGAAFSFCEDKPTSCILHDKVIDVDCYMNGQDMYVQLEPLIYIPAYKESYVFCNWYLIDSSGVPRILNNNESFVIDRAAKLIACFMPKESPNLSTVQLSIPNDIKVENVPDGWVKGEPGERATVYAKSNVPLGTKYASLQQEWENTKFSVVAFPNVEFKMTGWLLYTDCYSASVQDPVRIESKQLLSDNDIVLGPTNTINAKMCYSVDFESDEYCSFNADKLFIPIDLDAGGDTRISADEDNYIYFNLQDMDKPVISEKRSSLDFDETLAIQAKLDPGSFVDHWELHRYGLDEPTIITKTTDIWIGKDNPIQKVVLKTTDGRPIVKVDLDGGSVREGWEPEDWTKDATGHVYSKSVDGGTTFEMALRDWSLMDQRTECGDKVFSSWTLPEGKDINSLVENNDTIVARWAQMVDIPLHSKYPYLFDFANQQVSVPFENLKNVELAKNKYGVNFLIFRLSNDSAIEMEISNTYHYLDDLSGVRVYYYDKQNYKKAVFIPTGGDLLAALGGIQSIFDEISSFIRFDINVEDWQLRTLGKECGKVEVLSFSPGIIDVEPSDTIDDTESFLLLREDDQSASYQVEQESEGKLRLWLRDLFTGYEEYFTLIPKGDIPGYWTYQYDRINDLSPHYIDQLPAWQSHLFQAYPESQNDSCDMPGLQDQQPQDNFNDVSFPQDGGANSGAAALFAAGPALAFLAYVNAHNLKVNLEFCSKQNFRFKLVF